MFGPVFLREASVAPKRPRFYLSRSIYLLALFLLMCTGYLVLSGLRPLRSAGDLARYGGWMFLLLAPLQMLVLSFQAAVGSASSVAQEKDRRTILLLLLTRLSGSELVVGKLSAGLIGVLTMLTAALPLFLLLPLFGGVSPGQVGKVYAVTLATLVLASTVGTVVALWREKTFQAIAFTVLALVLWAAFGECVAAEWIPGIAGSWAPMISPPRALLAAASPLRPSGLPGPDPTLGFSLVTLLISLGLISVGVAKIRVWNPSRDVRLTPPHPESSQEAASASAVASPQWKVREPRHVWKNPILWREVCTWAYGRKVMIIRLAYLLLCLLAGLALAATIESGEAFARTGVGGRTLPAATLPVAAIGVISLLMVNALAVSSITSERDVLALDLLMVTDLRPAEFIFGKLWGVLYVTKEMVLVPLATMIVLGALGVTTVENTVYAVLGLVCLFVFVAALGIHCGLNYPAGRTATLVSLGTVFFLCVGVAICMVIMVSFRGAFQLQLAPFLTMILGGGAALYAALGWRTPSSAIFTASFALPVVTFYAITQFLLQRDQLFVVATVVVGYGFATAAMLVPALSEFDVSLERQRGEGGDA
jgi:ABC-type transport system involved in multi-copper enzyme maturation permease subunit